MKKRDFVKLRDTLVGTRIHFKRMRLTECEHRPRWNRKKLEMVVGLQWLAEHMPEAMTAITTRRLQGQPAVLTQLSFFKLKPGEMSDIKILPSDRVSPYL